MSTTVFQLENVTPVHLTHVNVRRELHGEEHVPAMDLGMRMEGGNELLNMLDSDLREALYCNRAAQSGQDLLPAVLAVLPNLRQPKLNGQKFKWAPGERHKGYRLVLDYGLGDERSNEDLQGCIVTKWGVECKEGGTVIIDWVVQCSGEQLTSDVRGKLTGLTDEQVHVQLLAPAQPQVVRGKDKPPAADGSDDSGTGDLLDGDGDGEGEGGDGEADDGSSPPAGSAEAAFIAEAKGKGAWPFPPYKDGATP